MTELSTAAKLVASFRKGTDVVIKDKHIHDDKFFDIVNELSVMMQELKAERLSNYVNFDFEAALKNMSAHALPPNPEYRRLVLILCVTCVAQPKK